MKWVSVLCVVHCLALPVLAALLGVADVERFHEGPWRWLEYALIAIALTVSGIQVFRAVRRRKFVLGGLGSASIGAVVIALSADSHASFVIAMLCVAAFQVAAGHQLKKRCSCPHPH